MGDVRCEKSEVRRQMETILGVHRTSSAHPALTSSARHCHPEPAEG